MYLSTRHRRSVSYTHLDVYKRQVTNKLSADRRRIHANLPRDVGLRVSALQERINLAALFAGQMEIGFGHFPSVRFVVPRKDSLHPVSYTHLDVYKRQVMPVERRGRVIAVELGPTGLYPGRSPKFQRKAAAFER